MTTEKLESSREALIATGDTNTSTGLHLLAAVDAEIAKATPMRTIAIPAAIQQMANRLAADPFEHCTSDPIFNVQKRRILSGLDTDYCDRIGWFNDGCLLSGEEAAVMEAQFDETGEVPGDYVRTGILETWEHYATYVTLDSAEAFVTAKGEDFRVDIDSGCRNAEWKALRAFLLSLAVPA